MIGWKRSYSSRYPPSVSLAGAKYNSGARLRVMAAATSERRRGDSWASTCSVAATDWPGGITTRTRRRPQSGAGETSSMKRLSRLLLPRARFKAHWTRRQNCWFLLWVWWFEDELRELSSDRDSKKSGSTDDGSLREPRFCLFKNISYWHAPVLRAHGDVRLGRFNFGVGWNDGR